MHVPVSIIVPVYNSETTIFKCIKTIVENNKNIKKEIIIINDGSNDKTLEIIKKIKNVKIINFKKNKGVGNARQYGAKIAKYDTLCYVDSDLFISKNSIKKLIKKLNSNINVGSVGAIQKTINLNKKKWSSNFVCLKSCYGFEDVEKEVEFTVIHSEFCVISKKYLISIGGWKFFSGAGGEEFELGHRILKSKKKIILIKDANYVTYYADLFTRFKEIINRTEKYIDLLIKKKHFDSEGSFATSNQAFSALTTSLYIFIIFISTLVKMNYFYFIISIVFLQVFIEFNFLKYSFKIYGFKMLLFSLFGIQIINLGLIIGSIKYILKKLFI